MVSRSERAAAGEKQYVAGAHDSWTCCNNRQWMYGKGRHVATAALLSD